MKQQELFEIDPEPPSSGTLLLDHHNSLRHDLISGRDTFCCFHDNQEDDYLITRFRREYFPLVQDRNWNDWKWQLGNRICKAKDLERYINLSPQEKSAMSMEQLLPLSITPYYMGLVDRNNDVDPIRRCVIPTSLELARSPGEEEDPLHEDGDSPVPGIVHRYPDRVLFLATGFCSTYCRYCTRSRMVGHKGAYGTSHWDICINYIKSKPTIRDVLISGGDPLTMKDEQLEYILRELRQISHVEIIRIGSKVPAVLPQRITRRLCIMLKKFQPLYLSLHFTHPRELTKETVQACSRLADAGIPLGSQTVLLKGINDQIRIMKKLNQKLLMTRVRPYYLYQCDPISGSGHFRTTIDKGLVIMAGLRGHTTGYAVPQYVVDLPGGGGKTPMLPDYCQGRTLYGRIFRNFEDKPFVYPEPLDQQEYSGLNMVSQENLTRRKQ